MWTKTFWKSTAERVIGTAAAVAAPTFIGASAWDIDYRAAAGLTLASSAFTFLKCIVSATIGDKGTPSFIVGGE